MEELACLGAPELAGLVEGAGDDLVAVWVIEGDRVDDIPVTLKREQLVPGDCVPDLAGPVVATGDELVARLVEGAVGEGQNVCAEYFKEEVIRALVAVQLLQQLYYRKSDKIKVWDAFIRQ